MELGKKPSQITVGQELNSQPTTSETIIPGLENIPRGQEDSEEECKENTRPRSSPKMRHVKDLTEGLAQTK